MLLLIIVVCSFPGQDSEKEQTNVNDDENDNLINLFSCVFNKPHNIISKL